MTAEEKAEELAWRKRLFSRRTSLDQGGNFAGLEYNLETAGAGGCECLLFVTDATTPEQIADAKSAARNSQDVVCFSIWKIPQEWFDEEKFTPAEQQVGWVAAVREILSSKSFRRIHEETGELLPRDKQGGTAVDLFTASVVMQVHDALGTKNQAHFASMPIGVAISLAYKLTEKCKVS